MPYRDRATVERWTEVFLATRTGPQISVTVLERNFEPAPNSGMVVVGLRDPRMLMHLHTTEHDVDGPKWVVTFEPRAEALELDTAATARLAAELEMVAELCGHLQRCTDEVIPRRDAPSAW